MARKNIRDYGKCIYLKSADSSYIDCGTVNPGSGDLSFNFFYRGEFNGGFDLIAKRDAWDDITGSMWQIARNDTTKTLHFERWGGGVDLEFDMVPGNWHMLTITHAYNSEIKVYQDSVLKKTLGGFDYGTKPTAKLSIGQNGQGGEFYNGKLDDVSIFSKVLTQAEITALFLNTKLPTDISNLVIYYDFDEASGATAIDKSGNGNDGTIVGGTRNADVVMKARVAI